MFQIRNATLPDGSRRTIHIDGSTIVSVEAARPDDADGMDASGLLVVPGGIDPHVHFRAPGGEHKETWETGVRAALLGGVTTVYDMPNTSPPLTTAERLEEKARLVGERPIDYRFWFGSTPDNGDDLLDVMGDERVVGVKTFLGSSTGDLLVTDDDDLRRIASLCAEYGRIWAVHCEDEQLLRQKRARLGRVPRVADHCRIRDTIVEVTAVRRVLRIAAEAGCEPYFVHLSTPESIELVHSAKQRGMNAWVEVCPHHWMFSEERLWGSDGPFFKMNPPLRTPQQVLRLRKLLARSEFVDTVGTDHAPHMRAEKAAPGYDQVPSGVPGVQTRFGLLFDFVQRGELTLDRLVGLTARNAALIFGEATKGDIAPGYDADLVLVDPSAVMEFRHETMASRCGWTPYDGVIVPGAIRAVVARGVMILV